MIENFTKADEKYGRRVRENMEQKIKAMKVMEGSEPKLRGKPAANKMAQSASGRGQEAE